MYLCFTNSAGSYSANEVNLISDCSGYIAVSAAELSNTLTPEQSSVLISASIQVLVLAFLFRLIRKQLIF